MEIILFGALPLSVSARPNLLLCVHWQTFLVPITSAILISKEESRGVAQ